MKHGIRGVTDEDSQRVLIVIQASRFCPRSSRLPEKSTRMIAQLPGVREVMSIQLWTNTCRTGLDIIVFDGGPPLPLKQARILTLISGDWSRCESQRDTAIVGLNVAAEENLITRGS